MLTNEVRSSFRNAGVKLGVQSLELVLDLGPCVAADLLADPLPVRGEAERDHPAPAPSTGSMVSAVLAVRPVIEVDAVFAVATALSVGRAPSLRLGSHNGSHAKAQQFERCR